MSTSEYPLGIRLNNPGLIRRAVGVGYEPDTVNGFSSLKSMTDGIVAQCVLLHQYYFVLQRRALFQIIPRWAPASENDVEQYVNLMVGFMGITDPMPAHVDLNFGHAWCMAKFILAQHIVENGHPPKDWPSYPNWVGISQMSVAMQRSGLWSTV